MCGEIRLDIGIMTVLGQEETGPNSNVLGDDSYGWKGPFHVWETETEDEWKEAEIEIAHINAEMAEEAEQANAEWRASLEWPALVWEQELEAAHLQCAAEKARAPKKKTPQSWRGKKVRVDKIKRAEHTWGVDAWRYVKHITVPLMLPECQRRLQDNLEFVLIEDGAASHSAQYTSRE